MMRSAVRFIVALSLFALVWGIPSDGWAFEEPSKLKDTAVDKFQDGGQQLQTTAKELQAACDQSRAQDGADVLLSLPVDSPITIGGEAGARALAEEIRKHLETKDNDTEVEQNLREATDKLHALAREHSALDTSGEVVSHFDVDNIDPSGLGGALVKAANSTEFAGRIGLNKVTATDELCDFYCPDGTPQGENINICALTDNIQLATVAYSVDPDSAEAVIRKIDKTLKSTDSSSGLDALVLVSGALGVEIDNDPAPAGRTGGDIGGLPSIVGSVGSVTDLTIRVATALGKLAIDRAQQEGVLWALDQLNEQLCDPGPVGRNIKTDNVKRQLVTHEISTYWLPQVCALTRKENLDSGFGAGEAMLKALVSAVENDGRSIPGTVAGLLVGLSYWGDDNGTGVVDRKPVELFECDGSGDDADQKKCDRAHRVRLATAEAVNGLLSGSDPVDQVRTWSADLDEINRGSADNETPGQYVLEAPRIQLAACGAAVAADFAADKSRRVVVETEDGPVSDLHQFLASVTTAPACWTLVGHGYKSAACQSAGDCQAKALALDRRGGHDVERLSTVLRLGATLEGARTRVSDSWRALTRAADQARGARESLQGLVGNGAGASVIVIDGDRDDDSDGNDDDDKKSASKSAQERLERAKSLVLATLDLADSILGVAEASGALLEGLTGDTAEIPNLLPGLLLRVCPQSGNCVRERPPWTNTNGEIRKEVQAFNQHVAQARVVMDAVREVVGEDWAAAASKSLSVLDQLLSDIKDGPSISIAEAEEMVRQATSREDKIARSSAQLDHGRERLAKVSQELAQLEKIPGTPPDKLAALRADVKKATQTVEQLARKIEQLGSEARKLRYDAKILRGDTTADSRKAFANQLGQLVGIFTAIIAAKDADGVAVILEKTAAPPGAWRRKQVPGAFTLSIGSHVGAYVAAELRVGQYGVRQERGLNPDGRPYLQAPTLAVPIGLDFAWGLRATKRGRRTGSLGFFLPIIDPAAFVQYDVSENGRLPGPRPVTVLSPGALVRYGIPRTPFTFVCGYMYRPQLRTWEATVSEPGADAHQFGVMIAVDATFWSIVKR